MLLTIIDCSKARGNPRGDTFEPLEEIGAVWLLTNQGDASTPWAFGKGLEGLVKMELVTVSGSKVTVTPAGLLSAARWRERHST